MYALVYVYTLQVFVYKHVFIYHCDMFHITIMFNFLMDI